MLNSIEPLPYRGKYDGIPSPENRLPDAIPWDSIRGMDVAQNPSSWLYGCGHSRQSHGASYLGFHSHTEWHLLRSGPLPH